MLDKIKKTTIPSSISNKNLVRYYIYYKLLKTYHPVFYKYGFWLTSFFKKKLSLHVFRHSLLTFPKFFIFFPYHKLNKQIFLRDVNFYSFFLENPQYKGIFLPKYIYSNTSKITLTPKYKFFYNKLYGGANYHVTDSSWSLTKNYNISNKTFDKNISLQNPSIVFKGVGSFTSVINYTIFQLTFLNIIFYLYLSQLRDYYNMFIFFCFVRN